MKTRVMRLLLAAPIVVGLIAALNVAAWADVQTTILRDTNAADTFFYNGEPDHVFIDSQLYWYDQRGTGNFSGRPIIKFDLPALPDNAVINSFELRLKVQEQTYIDSNNGSAPVPQNFSVHRMLVGWNETQATWNERMTGTGWSTAGMAAGIDYDSAALDTITVAKAAEGTYVAWNITSLAKPWYAGTADNHGVHIRGPAGVAGVVAASGDTTDGLLRLYNSEYGDDNFRPLLVIDYSIVPEPASLVLATIGGLMLLLVARRRRAQ